MRWRGAKVDLGSQPVDEENPASMTTYPVRNNRGRQGDQPGAFARAAGRPFCAHHHTPG